MTNYPVACVLIAVKRRSFYFLLILFPFIGLLSCTKSNGPSVPTAETPIPDSVVLSYADGQQWKPAYTYHLEYDASAHLYTVEETDQTFAPLPLPKTRKRFYLSEDGKQLLRVVTQQYSVFSNNTAIPVASMSLDLLSVGASLAPQAIMIQGYQDVDGTMPEGTPTIFTVELTEGALALPFDVRTRTLIPVLPTGNQVTEYIVQYRQDSLLAVKGDFDLKGSYFDNVAPRNAGDEIYFNNFWFAGDTVCHQYTFDKTWAELVWSGNQGSYIYHPMARKKEDFKYNSNTRALAAIFNSIDPGWFSPYKTMVNEYTMDAAVPKKSTRTFCENISSSYTDSLFTYTQAGDRVFNSAITHQNTVTMDSKGRIISLLKQPGSGTEQAVKYTFFYKE